MVLSLWSPKLWRQVINFSDTKLFFDSIPRDLDGNIKFRKKLHTYLENHPEDQLDFIKLCLADRKIAFNSCLWTTNPRGLPGFRHWPFILRPKQEEVVNVMQDCITPPYSNMGINKCRDEGCTEVVCKNAAISLFEPDTYIIVGSRNKDLVDCLGDPFTLMAKVDYAINTMPVWMQEQLGRIERKEMQLVVPKFNSVIKGETTNENFSAGRRATWMFLDEFGRVEPRIAKSIEGSVHDVTDCVIYGSTHWYGEAHPFNQVLLKKTTKVVELPWFENPVKTSGLYKSPDYNVIEIVDVDYYRQKYPEIKTLHSSSPFKLSELDKDLLVSGYKGDVPRLVADGCEQIPGFLRSPWHDDQEETRKGNKRDFVSNVWMTPLGSQDSFFDLNVLRAVEKDFGHPARYVGELDWKYDTSGKVENSIRFVPDAGRRRLSWWGRLKNLRPFQNHNYVIGCDLSYGSGNSNSVAAIYDVHTQEIVGTWVCPNTPPDKFMDTVVALARWCGGLSGEALIIYESNGPGVNAHKRLLWNGHHRIYVQRSEESRTRKIQNKYGWASTAHTKEALLGDLGVALTESLRQSVAKRCIVHDAETIVELRSYVFYESGDLGISSDQDTTSGARKRHGDRVIAVALCVLGSKYQSATRTQHNKQAKFGSFAWRQEFEKQLTANKSSYKQAYYGR